MKKYTLKLTNSDLINSEFVIKHGRLTFTVAFVLKIKELRKIRVGEKGEYLPSKKSKSLSGPHLEVSIYM